MKGLAPDRVRQMGFGPGPVVVRIQVTTPLHPTEVATRVTQAACAFVPDADVEVTQDQVTVRGRDLEALQKRIWELRIIDTVRGALLGGLDPDGRTIRFRLSKQAALQERVSLPAAPHVLGDLDWMLTVEEGDPWGDAEALAWWLCPETHEGEIVGHVD